MDLKNKITKEIFATFFDDGTYTEMFAQASNAVAVSYGVAGGQPVYAVSQNGNAVSSKDVDLVVKAYDLAAKTGKPLVCFYQSPGSILEEGLAPLKAAAMLNEAAAKVSGVVPLVAVVIGVCGASSALAAANSDFCIMAKEAELFFTPPFISELAGEKKAGAGTADLAVKAGVVSIVSETAKEAVKKAVEIISLLPSNNLSLPCGFEAGEPSEQIDFANYSASQAVNSIADAGSALFLSESFGENVQIALATVAGSVVGLVATGGKDTEICFESASKMARFVRFCDAFSIPIVTLINTAGFVKSINADITGGLRAAARLTSTYSDATTARVAVVSGKAVGSSFVALANADVIIAVDGEALIAPVEPSAAVSVIYKDDIQNSNLSIETATSAGVKEYTEKVASAKAAQNAGIVDIVVEAKNVRLAVEEALNMLSSKREQRLPKKHGSTSL